MEKLSWPAKSHWAKIHYIYLFFLTVKSGDGLMVLYSRAEVIVDGGGGKKLISDGRIGSFSHTLSLLWIQGISSQLSFICRTAQYSPWWYSSHEDYRLDYKLLAGTHPLALSYTKGVFLSSWGPDKWGYPDNILLPGTGKQLKNRVSNLKFHRTTKYSPLMTQFSRG